MRQPSPRGLAITFVGLSIIVLTTIVLNAKENYLCSSKAELQLSLRESLGFFEEPDEHWQWRKARHAEQMRRESAFQLSGFSDSGKAWFQIYYEPSFGCALEQRIGRIGDGGKWICDPPRIVKKMTVDDGCLVYSVGSNGDFSFEWGVHDEISKHCEIHIFDPAPLQTFMKGSVVNAMSKYMNDSHSGIPPSATYHAVAMGPGTGEKTLHELRKTLGHTQRQIDILKIDCEGCEWSTYFTWLSIGATIRQILIELHWPLGAGAPETAHRFFQYLTDHGYVVFHKEPNTMYCGGECIEYAFIKLDPSFGQSSLAQNGSMAI